MFKVVVLSENWSLDWETNSRDFFSQNFFCFRTILTTVSIKLNFIVLLVTPKKQKRNKSLQFVNFIVKIATCVSICRTNWANISIRANWVSLKFYAEVLVEIISILFAKVQRGRSFNQKGEELKILKNWRSSHETFFKKKLFFLEIYQII